MLQPHPQPTAGKPHASMLMLIMLDWPGGQVVFKAYDEHVLARAAHCPTQVQRDHQAQTADSAPWPHRALALDSNMSCPSGTAPRLFSRIHPPCSSSNQGIGALLDCS